MLSYQLGVTLTLLEGRYKVKLRHKVERQYDYEPAVSHLSLK